MSSSRLLFNKGDKSYNLSVTDSLDLTIDVRVIYARLGRDGVSPFRLTTA